MEPISTEPKHYEVKWTKQIIALLGRKKAIPRSRSNSLMFTIDGGSKGIQDNVQVTSNEGTSKNSCPFNKVVCHSISEIVIERIGNTQLVDQMVSQPVINPKMDFGLSAN